LYFNSFPLAVHDRKWGGGSCLGEDGLPANPDFILGFNYTDYNLANYLVINFVFKNHTEETKNAMAEAWEKAFLSYMKKYVQNPKHSNLTIRFSAEGLVVDEITTPSTSTDRNSGCSAEATTFRLLTGVIAFVVLLSRISF
jgi:Niemann-Pick C1 protein